MSLKLHNDWRKILKSAWSIRCLVLAMVLSGIEIALPLVQDILPIPRGVFAALSALATGGAFGARLIAQSQFKGSE